MQTLFLPIILKHVSITNYNIKERKFNALIFQLLIVHPLLFYEYKCDE